MEQIDLETWHFGRLPTKLRRKSNSFLLRDQYLHLATLSKPRGRGEGVGGRGEGVGG